MLNLSTRNDSFRAATSIRTAWWTVCKLCVAYDTPNDDVSATMPTTSLRASHNSPLRELITPRDRWTRVNSIRMPDTLDRISNHPLGLSTPLKQVQALPSRKFRGPCARSPFFQQRDATKFPRLPCGHRVKSLGRTLHNPARPARPGRFTSSFTTALRSRQGRLNDALYPSTYTS